VVGGDVVDGGALHPAAAAMAIKQSQDFMRL